MRLFKQYCKEKNLHLKSKKHNELKRARNVASSKIKEFKMPYCENFFLKNSEKKNLGWDKKTVTLKAKSEPFPDS